MSKDELESIDFLQDCRKKNTAVKDSEVTSILITCLHFTASVKRAIKKVMVIKKKKKAVQRGLSVSNDVVLYSQTVV